MIYIGDNQPTICLRNNEPIIYLGDNQVYPMGPFVGIRMTKSLSYPKSGDTLNIKIKSSDSWEIVGVPSWLTLSSTAGTSGNTTITATAPDNQTGSALTATLTAYTTNSAYSATCQVEQVYCNPIVITSITTGDYTITADSTTTAITSCEYDFTGVRSIADGGGIQPHVVFSSSQNGTRQYVKYVSIDTSTVERWNYAFNEMAALEYLEFDLSNTNVMDNGYYRCNNLKTLVINNINPHIAQMDGALRNDGLPSLTDVYINGTIPASCNCQFFADWGSADDRHSCPALTIDSLRRIIAALANGGNGKYCYLGSTNMNKLSAADIQAATDKGWILE